MVDQCVCRCIEILDVRGYKLEEYYAIVEVW